MNSQPIDQAYHRLETVRLVLRALRTEDADFILQEWGSSAVTHYMRDEEPFNTLGQAIEWLPPFKLRKKCWI